MHRQLRAVLLAGLAMAAPAAAQTSGTSGAGGTLAVPPIECWWRNGTSAVRVGEPFTVTLTCAVLETVSTTVVPDQSRLDPAVVQLQPFEVTGGRQAPDLKTPSRRFFQYEYTVRYFGEEFGREVPLPSFPIAYRVQTRSDANAAAIETRDRQYVMPSLQVRIASLVPNLATEIRERTPDSFADIDQRRFRASLLNLLSSIAFALAAVVAVWAAVRAIQRRRGTVGRRDAHVSDATILAAVARELGAVASGKAGGWTPALAERLLLALRIAGTFETSGHPPQTPWTGGTLAPGALLARHPLRPGRVVTVTGAATSGALTRELARREARDGAVGGPIVDLRDALLTLESALYARETPARLDLDDTLAAGERAVGRLRRTHSWLALRLAAIKASVTGLGTRVWAR